MSEAAATVLGGDGQQQQSSGDATVLGGENGQQQQQQATEPKGFLGEDGSSFRDGWLDSLPDDLKEHRGNFEKYKTLPDLLKGYQHASQALGKKGIIIPTDKSTPEEIAAYRKAMGIPETADKYDLKPEHIPDGLTWDDNLGKQFAEIAHKHGVPASAMKALSQHFATWQEGTIKALVADGNARAESIKAELTKEWGDKAPANFAKATAVAQKIGIDPKNVRDPHFVRALVRFSELVSEGRFVQGDHASSIRSPGEEAKSIMTDKNHPLYERYQRGDKEAQTTVNRLLQEAA